MSRRDIEGAIVTAITWAGLGLCGAIGAGALWATSFLNL